MNRVHIIIEVDDHVEDGAAEAAMYGAVDWIARLNSSLTSEDYDCTYSVERPDDFGFDPTPQT